MEIRDLFQVFVIKTINNGNQSMLEYLCIYIHYILHMYLYKTKCVCEIYVCICALNLPLLDTTTVLFLYCIFWGLVP